MVPVALYDQQRQRWAQHGCAAPTCREPNLETLTYSSNHDRASSFSCVSGGLWSGHSIAQLHLRHLYFFTLVLHFRGCILLFECLSYGQHGRNEEQSPTAQPHIRRHGTGPAYLTKLSSLYPANAIFLQPANGGVVEEVPRVLHEQLLRTRKPEPEAMQKDVAFETH